MGSDLSFFGWSEKQVRPHLALGPLRSSHRAGGRAAGRKFSSTHNSESAEEPPLPANVSCRPSLLIVRSNRPHLLCSPAFSGLPPSMGTRHRSQIRKSDGSGALNRM
jgi:hypothetical protein